MRGVLETGGALRQPLFAPFNPEPASHPPPGDASPGTGDIVLSLPGRPGGVAAGPDGTLWVSMLEPAAIWKVRPGGPVTSLALGGPGGAPLAPAGLAVAPGGALVVADRSGQRVCTVEADGTVRVLAGGTSGDADGPGPRAQFRHPTGVALGGDGACYVADAGNDRIRRIDPDGVVTTVAGSIYDYGDGRGVHARFRRPSALAADPAGGCYVGDTGNNALRRVDPGGLVTTLAGGPPGGDGDGPGAAMRWPTGVAAVPGDAVLVADQGNRAVRLVAAGTGRTDTVWRDASAWPVAVAAAPGWALAVLTLSWAGARRPRACLMVIPGLLHRA